MKKTIKSKLRLNSQTIRSLRAHQIQQVEGGRVMVIQTDDDSMNCSLGCRGCG
jgi:hypothetical protein